MTNQHELKALPKIFIKGLIVVGIAFLLSLGMNAAMQSFLDAEVAVVQAAAERAAEIERQLKEAQDEAQAKRLAAELEVRKAEQYEEFYQKYKKRDSYHYYGQFYEMYMNLCNADTIIIGTSHAAHGINPLYLEESITDRSIFNFALNGSNPAYYVEWFKLFEESGYPMPKTIIYAVDWFMCDEGWLWRRIDFDTNPDCAATIARKIRKSQDNSAAAAVEEEASAESAAETELIEEEEKKINWLDVDEATTYLFSRIPIIYSRDRIPDMLRYFTGGNAFAELEAEPELPTESGEEDALPEVPVYKHSFHQDSLGNIDSEYYKGYITWKAGYGGGKVQQGCTLYDNQKKAFVKLMDMFKEWGVEVIFVECPEYLEGRNAPQFKKCNEYVTGVAADYGIPFFDYNTTMKCEINDDYRNYSDWGHMNGDGAEKFSRLLGQHLAQYWAMHDGQ